MNLSSLASSSGSPQLEGLKIGVLARIMAFDGFDYFCNISDKRKSFVALWKEEVLLAATFPWGINPFIFCFRDRQLVCVLIATCFLFKCFFVEVGRV